MAMIDMSSRTRKKAKHNGIITSQSFRPESHWTSVLGSDFSASENARCASVAISASPVFMSRASWSCKADSCLSWRSGEDGGSDRGEAIVDMLRKWDLSSRSLVWFCT